MKNRPHLHVSAFVISLIALFVALGGGVYAATKINGKTIKVKSLPGNRLALHSVPANRLKPGLLSAGAGQTTTTLTRELTGSEINETTLAQVPDAAHADQADNAKTATDAQTALNAVNAINADTVNGHSAGCLAGTEPFAGACWEKSARGAATALAAAAECASAGATLPNALELAAFAQVPGVNLVGSEWSGDITNFSGQDIFAVVTVSDTPHLNFTVSSLSMNYRCVFPLVI